MHATKLVTPTPYHRTDNVVWIEKPRCRFRRCSLLVAFLFANSFAGSLAAADRLTVLDPEQDGAVDQILLTYLVDQMRPHFAARVAEIESIKTPEQFYQRQARIREQLFRINGEFPSKTPLNGQIVGSIERDGYTIEKVIYESRPQHYVTANFYLPNDGEFPVPGVLIPCGHSSNGKASEAYQSIAISLALHGMAALVYDPIGQGERNQIVNADGSAVVRGTTEHTLLGTDGWLVGLGAANFRIWDGIRSLDYLASRPEVDAERLGCTGNSGGGTMTSYLMAFDQRIKAAAPSCYLTTLERLFDTIGPQDAEQHFPGQVALGIDHADYIGLRAPLPTLMCVARRDFFDIDGAWTTFTEAKRLYSMLGHSERIDIIDYDDTHGFSQPRRQAAMRFMRRWLLGKDDNPDEPELQISTDEELQCTRTGQVQTAFGDAVSVVDIVRRRALDLAADRKSRSSRPAEEQKQAIRQLTGIRESIATPTVVSRGTITVDSAAGQPWMGTIEKLVLTRAREVPVPALLLRPNFARREPPRAVVYVSGLGKSDYAENSGPIDDLLQQGFVVLSIDVRGIGETAAAVPRARDGYFGTDFQSALLALHLQRPLVGQRAEDVIAAVNFLAARDDIDTSAIDVVGTGSCGPVVLHAATFDDRIRNVRVTNAIESWENVVHHPLARNQLTNVVPFALETYDLPDLVELIGSDQVTIADPLDLSAEQ